MSTKTPNPSNTAKTPSPDLQGEGNYDATRRYRKSVETFVESGAVEPAAKAAAPKDEAERQALAEAEKAGRKPARN